MSYFAEQYDQFRWNLDRGNGAPGLRRPQAGALHALAAHFSHARPSHPVRREPAIVTMPTGSGKTAVLMALPYLLEAKRVLVVTPSRLVREQIADDFSQLGVLRRLGVLATDGPVPTVQTVSGRIASLDAWEELREADLVVGTPSSLSPTMSAVPQPPTDLFDLVLVDEAHHAPATSWRGLLNAFPEAHRALFTATPFRRDRREIAGTFVYTYELAEAWRDGTFGEVHYEPVDPIAGQSDDEAIAIAASAQLRRDHDDSLDHRLLIRTASRARARELVDLYRAQDGLKVDLVLGDQGLRHVRRTIAKLREGELHGIVCVDMFGEGFDLPQLKVAALHAPHRSLAVALQFIGRFARTTGEKLGQARFFAAASDMRVERAALYEQGAAWDLLIPNLSAARVRREREVKEVLATFTDLDAAAVDGGVSPLAVEEPSGTAATRDISDVSLYSVRPYHHVKVLRAPDGVDVTRAIAFPAGLHVVLRKVSEKHHAAIYITRESARPDWATTDHFDGVSHDLVVIVHEPRTKLVFVCSSRRSEALYTYVAEALAPDGHPPLRGVPTPVLNKALLDLEDPIFFNVGLANAVAANQAESYRVLMGASAHDSIGHADARSFRRGHWFCGATQNGEKITLGLSSASKLWSNTSDTIPGLVRWCRDLARKLTDRRTHATACNMDLLAVGEEAHAVPGELLFADWPVEFYSQPRTVRVPDGAGSEQSMQLLDLALTLRSATTDAVLFSVRTDDGLNSDYTFTLNPRGEVRPDDPSREVLVERGRETLPLSVMLSAYAPRFYTATYGCLDGQVWHPPRPLGDDPFPEEHFDAWDWDSLGIDITNECRPSKAAGLSIHEGLEKHLQAGSADVVYYDHGSGEMADFVEILPFANGQPSDTLVRFYHCKGSGGAKAGARVADAYEVCGQAAKSLTWAQRDALLSALKRRLKRKRPSRFVRGDLTVAERLLGRGRRVVLEVVIVQPGFSKAELPGTLGMLLAAADEYLVSGPCLRLSVIGSS